MNNFLNYVQCNFLNKSIAEYNLKQDKRKHLKGHTALKHI